MARGVTPSTTDNHTTTLIAVKKQGSKQKLDSPSG